MFIFIAFTVLILTLRQGVRIENLSLPFVKVSQFYIKLDKKLIVSVQDVKIDKKENVKSSYEDVISYLDNIPLVNLLFESISIQKLHYKDNTIRLLFKEDVFYLDTKYVSLDSQIKKEGNEISLNISELFFKDYDTVLKGLLTLNFRKDEHTFKGTYEIKNLKGNLSLHVKNSLLSYELNVQKTSSIDSFMDFLNTKVKLEPEVSNWIYKYVRAKSYEIKYLKGQINLKTYNYYPKLIQAKGLVKDANITFHKDVPNASAREILLELKENKLNFALEGATYQKQTIEEPKVSIYNLLTSDTGIIIDINANTLLNTDIQKILHAYKIHIPLIQQSSTNKAHLMLNVDFIPSEIKEYQGEFDLQNSYAKFAGLDIFSKGGKIRMDNEVLTFQNVNMKYQNLFDITFSGILNTQTKHFDGDALIHSIDIDLKGTKLLHVKHFHTKVTFDIGEKDTTINLLDLNTSLTFNQKGGNFTLRDIKTLQKYSEVLKELDFTQATGTIQTEDYRHFNAEIAIKNFKTPLFYKNATPVRDFNLSIKTDTKNLSIQDSKTHLKLSYKNAFKISLNDYDIHTNFSSEEQNLTKKISVYAKNSNIFDTNSSKKILSNSFKLILDKNMTRFENDYKKRKLFYEKKPNSIYIQAQKLPFDFVNALLGTHTLSKGEITFYSSGTNFKDLTGTIFVENTTIKDLKFFNNLMAFINTIPSLITFKSPKFNEDGYEIQAGFINFTRKDNKIIFKDIKLKGYSADIAGKGTLDLNSSKIDMDLQISTLKDVSSIINKIPLLNNIVLGKGGKIYTDITVKGTLDKPDIKTHILEDTIFTPVNIIKRTLQLPFK